MEGELRVTADDEAEPPLGTAHRPLSHVVADAIRKAIVDGEFKSGTRLVEDRLAKTFGVSRNPVREAIRLLASEGLITIVPRHGAIVAALTAEEIRETVEVRATLEGLNARLAARHRAPDILPRLREILDAGMTAARTERVEELAALNIQFHEALARAGGNRVLGDLLRTLRERTTQFFVSTAPGHVAKTWAAHAEILNAVMAGDEELACLLAQRHVTNIDFLAGATAEEGSPPGSP
jgi:DNA-binding GntR family transcriptional regulator